MLLTPLKQDLKALILALKDSAEAFNCANTLSSPDSVFYIIYCSHFRC